MDLNGKEEIGINSMEQKTDTIDDTNSNEDSSDSTTTTEEDLLGNSSEFPQIPLINKNLTVVQRRKRAGSKSKRMCRTLTPEESMNLSKLKKEKTLVIIPKTQQDEAPVESIKIDPRTLYKAKSSLELNISTPRLLTAKKETHKTLETIKWNPNLKQHNAEKNASYVSLTDNFNLELGHCKITEDIEDFSPQHQLEDIQSYKTHYASYFYKKDHIIFMVEDLVKSDNNSIVCVRLNVIHQHYLCYLITKKGFQLHYIPHQILFPKRESEGNLNDGGVLNSKNKTVMKKVKEIVETMLLKVLGEPIQKVRFSKALNPKVLSKEIYKFEKDNTLQNIKIGILYTKKGDVKEDDIYNNDNPQSEKYKEFLNLVGKEVTLLNYRGFRGGLDVKKNTTGEKTMINTIYFSPDGLLLPEKATLFTDSVIQMDVMFHVATMLPFSHVENHQLAKKRHIGNDVVVIVFNDGNSNLNFDGFQSQFNHAFIIVTPLDDGDHYNLSIATKKEVKPCRPFVPAEGKIHKKDLCDFLLTKSLNLEKASLYANTFSTKTQRTFILSIADFFKNYKKK